MAYTHIIQNFTTSNTVSVESVKGWFKTEYPQLRAKRRDSPIGDDKVLRAYLEGLKRTCRENGIHDGEIPQMVWDALTREPEQMTVHQTENTGALVMAMHLAMRKGVGGTRVVQPLPVPAFIQKRRGY